MARLRGGPSAGGTTELASPRGLHQRPSRMHFALGTRDAARSSREKRRASDWHEGVGVSVGAGPALERPLKRAMEAHAAAAEWQARSALMPYFEWQHSARAF